RASFRLGTLGRRASGPGRTPTRAARFPVKAVSDSTDAPQTALPSRRSCHDRQITHEAHRSPCGDGGARPPRHRDRLVPDRGAPVRPRLPDHLCGRCRGARLGDIASPRPLTGLAGSGKTCLRPPVYSAAAVLGGELAVPCTRDPLHAGLNPRRRPVRSEAAFARGVEGRVLRDVGPRTGSGRERSSPKRFPAGAAGSPRRRLPPAVANGALGVAGGGPAPPPSPT